MKAKTLLLFMLFVSATRFYAFGQIDCTSASSNFKLVCQFPASAQTLAQYTFGLNTPQGTVIAGAAQGASLPINASIATQLTQLPIPSATVGVVSIRGKNPTDPTTPFFNLGPVLTDRPDTVGQGHLFTGFSYQHFNFNHLDGTPLNNLPVTFADSSSSVIYYGSESNNVSFKLDQYVLLFTYGVSKGTDVSLVVPVNSVNLQVTTSSFQAFTYSLASGLTDLSPPSTTSASSSGSASGLGDLTIGLKQLLIGGDGSRTAIAAGGTFRFPSGDSLNYLGSGAMGGNLYGLFEYRNRVAPHLKLSYQWNDTSKLMNPTGTTNNRLPGGLQFAAGADIMIVRPLTVAIDLLGNQFLNAPTLTVAQFNPPVGVSAPSGFLSVTTPNTTYTTIDFSTGVKWSPFKRHPLLLYGNVLFQANNVGLKSDPVPLFGAAYNFGKSRSK